jgi:hypothetical protein
VCDGADVLEWKWLELVLLEKVVEVLLQHLEHEAGVVLVREALVGPHKVELVRILLANRDRFLTYSLKYGIQLNDFKNG